MTALSQLEYGGGEIAAEVDAAGLRGRGGAGFPAARKLRLAAERGVAGYLVANGAEDEPGSRKDRHLLEHEGERVVEGAVLAARAAGACHVVFYLSAAVEGCLHGALEAHGLVLLPCTPRDPGNTLTASVVTAPDEYVAGEETAAIEAIQGAAAIPRSRPPFPTESGLWGSPTVVLNVETLAVLPEILEHGGAAYRRHPTILATLPDELRRPGVHRVALGISLRALLEDVGGGLRDGREIRAVLPGGPSSGFLGREELDLPLDADRLAAAGSSLGCAAVRVYAREACMACALREQLDFLAGACCGQCPPCRMETAMLVRLLDTVLAGGPPALLDKLDEVLDFAAGQGGRI
jgi:NADH:ubiquinone oxidoreductase subunit F (NADH-binding)